MKTLVNKIKKLINKPKQIFLKNHKIKLSKNEIGICYKANGFKFKDPCKVTKDCILKFKKNTFNRVYFEIHNPYIAIQNEVDSKDVIYFDSKAFKSIGYKNY